MSQSTKSQFYRYSLRTAALTGYTMCTHKAYTYISPPEDAQTIENLFCHLKITFDSAIDAGSQVLEEIGIASEWPFSRVQVPTYLNTIQLNQAADANRVIDIKIDLTSMLKKDNVRFDVTDSTGNFLQNDMTLVYIKLPDSLIDESNVGTIDIWKIDALFTTKEIR